MRVEFFFQRQDTQKDSSIPALVIVLCTVAWSIWVIISLFIALGKNNLFSNAKNDGGHDLNLTPAFYYSCGSSTIH